MWLTERIEGMEAINISYQAMIILYALIIVPVLICLLLKLGNVKKILIAVFRMTVQLAAMGFYLDYLFRFNNVWVNFGWVILMIAIANKMTAAQLSGFMYIHPSYSEAILNALEVFEGKGLL